MTSRSDRANAIRALSMDAVQSANSGHPGAPMGMADIAEVLWNDHLKHNPGNPAWADRDRFVLSNGHGSMLLYSVLNLSGYDLPMSELRNFRQLHSKTPGHPEYGCAPGIETTTGPLGQGLANAVGMAIAERTMAAQFNRPGHEIVDHHTYAFVGDGCLMEGISHESCSLAGTLGLGKLITIYDDNGISIDGDVEGWFADNTPKRFEAYGWHVIDGVDGHDPNAINKAINEARKVSDKPTLVCCKTVIGKGAPNKEGGHNVHGAPLGADEIAATRKHIGWSHPPFEIPEDIRADWDAKARGKEVEAEWNKRFEAYRAANPELAAEFERRMAGDLPADWEAKAQAYIAAANEKAESTASRVASQKALEAYCAELPEMLGGSADLTPSNNTTWSGSVVINDDKPVGNYMHYGVREFAMSAIMNGITLHGGLRPYGATFLVFADYARNALRVASLMGCPSLFVYTHDSIGLGEDGPTHQPVEHLTSLRIMPNMSLWRPADVVETAVAWKAGIERKSGPTSLIFSRQGLPHNPRTQDQIDAIARGGYVLVDCDGTPDVILIATGSEVSLATGAAEKLGEQGRKVRVVSMPSVDVYNDQDPAYRESVLPKSVTRRVVIEAGCTPAWYQFAGSEGRVIGIDSFGESAPAGDLFKHFGFTVDNVVNTANEIF